MRRRHLMHRTKQAHAFTRTVLTELSLPVSARCVTDVQACERTGVRTHTALSPSSLAQPHVPSALQGGGWRGEGGNREIVVIVEHLLNT